MSDITKCSSVICPFRADCLRATIDPHPYWQSYANFYREETRDNCPAFIPAPGVLEKKQ